MEGNRKNYHFSISWLQPKILIFFFAWIWALLWEYQVRTWQLRRIDQRHWTTGGCSCSGNKYNKAGYTATIVACGRAGAIWVLHIAEVWNFFSFPLPNAEGLISRPLPFFFFLKLSIFRFFSSILLCPNLHNAVGDPVSFQLVQNFTNFFPYHLDRASV